MTSHFIGFFVVLIVVGGVVVLPVFGILPEEANTPEYAKITNKDREIIFFINMYYTTITDTFYRLSFIVKVFYIRDRTGYFSIISHIMKILDPLRHIIGLRSPLRLVYHWFR